MTFWQLVELILAFDLDPAKLLGVDDGIEQTGPGPTVGDGLPLRSSDPLQDPLNVVTAVDDPGLGVQLDYHVRIGVAVLQL